MFKVVVVRTPKPGQSPLFDDVEVSIQNTEDDIKITMVHTGRDREYGFRYDDGKVHFVFTAQVVWKERKYWFVPLGNDFERSFGKSLSIAHAISIIKNIRDGVVLYPHSSEGLIRDVRFDMSNWSNWDGSRQAVFEGREI